MPIFLFIFLLINIVTATDREEARPENPFLRKRHFLAETPSSTKLHVENRMNTSLAERLSMLPRGGENSDFEKRLREEEEELAQSMKRSTNQKTPPNSHHASNLSWTLIWTAASFFVAAAIQNPAAVWKDMTAALNALLSIHWFRHMLQPIALLDVVATAHFVSKSSTFQSFREHIWPTVVSTMKTLLLAEAWSYFWKMTWRTTNTVVEKMKSEADNKVERVVASSTPEWIPDWMAGSWVKFNSVLDGIVKRGTRRIIQKVLQKNIQEAFLNLASHGVNVIQDQWYVKSTLGPPTP